MTADTLPVPPALSEARRDLLLTSARLLVTIIMILTIVVGASLTLAAVGVPIFHTAIAERIGEHARQPIDATIIAAISGFLVIMVVFTALAFHWLRELRRIIDSVGDGDPFNPVNAERLARMGWVTVIIEVLSIPGGALAAFLTHMFHRSHVEVGLSLGGILMALVLFILARVFREGAAMREELEGTV